MSNTFEEGPEHIPTPEEVPAVFKELVGETEFEETRKLEDEQGLYLWDIKIFTEDGYTEYSYRRGRREADELRGVLIYGEFQGIRIDVAFLIQKGFQLAGLPLLNTLMVNGG